MTATQCIAVISKVVILGIDANKFLTGQMGLQRKEERRCSEGVLNTVLSRIE